MNAFRLNAMALALSLFIGYMILALTFALDIGLAPGLSVKNAVLYLLLTVVFLRYTIQGGFKLRLPGIQICLAALVAYAIFSVVVVAMLDVYPTYDPIRSLMRVKSTLFDFMMFFLLFFYGLRTEREATLALKAILLVAFFANGISLLHGLGVVYIGTIPEGEHGRLDGVLGEQNQFGAYLSLFIPPLLAAVATSRGSAKAFWVTALVTSVGALLLTISRGAFVATFISSILALYLFRQYLSAPKVIGWGIAAIVVVSLIVATLGSYGGFILERVLAMASPDTFASSSGRIDLWGEMLNMMMRVPLAMLTGFGYNSYSVMPLTLAPHNTYLGTWFELGVPGLLLFVTLLFQLIVIGKRATDVASPILQLHLMAFVTGTLALAIAIFFVELYTPWPFFWAYAGVMMRLAVIASEGPKTDAVQAQSNRDGVVKRDKRFGWAAR